MTATPTLAAACACRLDWCLACYPKARKGPTPRTGAAFLEHFWSQVNKTEGCWLWVGQINIKDGYGQIRARRKLLKAHRVSYQIAKGPIPPGLSVCHTCDVTICVRPDHLWLGSQGDNVRDARDKGRLHTPKLIGKDQPNAKLTEDTILAAYAERVRQGTTIDALAARLGVSRPSLEHAFTGKTWSHLRERLDAIGSLQRVTWSEWERQDRGWYVHPQLGTVRHRIGGWYWYPPGASINGPHRTMSGAIAMATTTAGGGEANR